MCTSALDNRQTGFVCGAWRMVEGHQVHRVAISHRKRLLNSVVAASSPNGKFADGASAISGKTLARIEAHGKNLFYFFGNDGKPRSDLVVVHIHFGMSGRFTLFNAPGPEPGVNVRLKLTTSNTEAYLSSMICQHGGLELYDEKVNKLGEDPLREDAVSERFWEKVRSSKKSIGLMLMDQTAIAGVGNIYRAEILFRAGVHPEQPSNTLSREQFDRVWRESVLLLQRGVKTGSILTVDPAENLPEPWKRRYIYNHSECPRCHGVIRSWEISKRRAYACETCQPLDPQVISSDRKVALRKSSKHESFNSHCAPEPGAAKTVAELRQALRSAGLATSGSKAQLVERLKEAEGKVEVSLVDSDSKDDESEVSRGFRTMAVGQLRAAVRERGLRTNGTRSDLLLRLEQNTAAIKGEPVPEESVVSRTDRSAQGDEFVELEGKKVSELREQLASLSQPTSGKKAELVARLKAYLGHFAEDGEEAIEVRPGTAHLGEIRETRDAAMDKKLAGESAAVEHVGMIDMVAEGKDTSQQKIPFRKRKRRSPRGK
mmetsp:Transcript_18749/g.75330  ORF Transcript_18749/g.75330 Transcript_18749/m.75330 type:complete len:544 (-) Transcript_18749:1984-3615(-)